MRLLRFAIAIFHGQSSIRLAATRLGDVDVTFVEGKSEKEKDQAFLATATLALDGLPPKDEANRIVIPTLQRERCEYAIEAMTDLIATFYGCQRSVLSPAPSVALEFTTLGEKQYLYESRGIFAVHRGESGVRPLIPLEPKLIASISDRLVGVALIAEAYAGGESGKYREFTRFFELAFRRPFTQLDKKLETFFAPTPFGYTRAEIKRWIALRHPLSHADLKKSQAIAITSDVRRHILRMEQAALDVLFNKQNWADPSTTRRQVWVPDACSTSESGKVIVKHGTKLSLLFRTYDEFGTYPRMLTAKLSKIEDSWYLKINDDNAPKFQPNTPLEADA
jgi:hypothetical protein